jgi:hypothetical protein
MSNFTMGEWYKDTKRHSHCKVCGKTVTINSHPMPNEIDIGGEAVALNCGDNSSVATTY